MAGTMGQQRDRRASGTGQLATAFNAKQGGNGWLDFIAQQQQSFYDNVMLGGGLSQQQADALWNKVSTVWVNPTIDSSIKQAYVARMAGQLGIGGGGGGRGGGGGGGGGGMSAAQKAAQYTTEIENLAGQFGLEGDWSSLGAEAAANNWSLEMVRDMLADRITLDTANRAGLVKSIFDRTRAAGGDYFINISDDQLLDYSKRVARNELDQDAILSDVRNQAVVRYSWLGEQIKQGQTMRQIFAPHRESIAKLLELSPESIDFVNDQRFQRVVDATALDGQHYSLNIADTEKLVRNMDEWRRTNNAKSQAAAAVNALAKTFGSMG